MLLRNLFLSLCFALVAQAALVAQTTIVQQDFETSPATPLLTFTSSGGAFSTGNNGSGIPANADLFASGARGWQMTNGTSTLTFANRSLTGYTNCFVEFRLAGMSVNGTNGIDGADVVTVAISTDGGTNYSNELTIAGSAANQRWDFTASGSTSVTYDGNNTPTPVTSSTAAGISTVRVDIPNAVTQVRLKITLLNNDANERWVIDDVAIKGTDPSIATQLAIASISPTSPTAGSGFSVTVQSLNALGNATSVAAATGFTLTTNGNAGAIGGTTSGTIAAGTSSIVVSGVTLPNTGTNVTLTATRTSGDNLTAGTSASFSVLAAASKLAFVNVPASGIINANLASFTVEARRPDNSVDNTYTGTITLTKASGPGTLNGTLSVAAVAGVATFSTVKCTQVGTYTLTASSGALTQATSTGIDVGDASLATDYFRSKSATGTWISAGSWESSHDGTTNWMTATTTPDFNASEIRIQSGHFMTYTAGTNIDDLIIEEDATMQVITNLAFFWVRNGTAVNDFDIGGTLQFVGFSSLSEAMSIFSGAKINVRTGGRILIGDGTGSALGSEFEQLAMTSAVVWNDGAIFEWNSSNKSPNMSNTWFSFISESVVPIVRLSLLTSYPQNLASTTFFTMNGRLEANVNVNFSGASSKNIRNGISGSGNVTLSGAGALNINGLNATLSGTGTITLAANMIVGSTSNLTLLSDKTINGNAFIVNGTLTCDEFALNGTAAFTSGANSGILTKHANGVDGSIALSGAKTFHAATNYTFNGTSSAQVTGSLLTSCKDLTIDNPNGVALSQSVVSSGTTNFSSGKLTLGDYSLTIATFSGAAFGSNATSYAVAEGTGSLSRTISTNTVFPVGTASTYMPVRLSGSGTYSVKIAPTASGLDDPSRVLTQMWDIAGSGAVDMGCQWTEDVEGANFPPLGSVRVFRYSSTWSEEGTGTSTQPVSGVFTASFASVPCCSGFTVGAALALPVELLSFTAKKEGNVSRIAFSTATETNNARFIIERSADARAFTAIGQVLGAGTTQVRHDYTFVDEKPLTGTNYYRLRQVDYDGRESWSAVVGVVFGQSGRVVVAPSPATDRVTIHLEEPVNTDGVWEVLDHTGRLVLSGDWSAEGVDYEFNVYHLPEGAYTFRLVAGAQVWVKQFWKM